MLHRCSTIATALALSTWLAPAGAFASPKNPDREETVLVYRNTQAFFDIAGWPDDGLYTHADVHIHDYPARGEVKVDVVNKSFVFYPDVDLCAAGDEFVYTIKYGDWMETYRMVIEIVCDAPTIMASFSPSGSAGDYRSFTIIGVQSFPDNSLSVFDRSGKPVFSAKDYENTWEGLLPDGTYAKPDEEFLYVFDDGQGNLYSGYVKVQ